MSFENCWAKIDKTTGSLNEILNIYFENNATGKMRSVKIRVSDGTDAIIDEYTLVQRSVEVTTYYNTRQSQVFTRNNCEDGYSGESVEYVVDAGTYTSTVSQADADQKALDDIAMNGQDYANRVGSCTRSTWYSSAMSGYFTKNDCDPDTEEGTMVEFAVPEGLFTSTVSQADADAQAAAYLEENGQAYANTNGECITVKWYNEERSATFQRNDCSEDEQGTEVEYVVEAGRFSSTISQEDANAQADAALFTEGQAHANEVGECVAVQWRNVAVSGRFQRNDCPDGETGTFVDYEIEAGRFISIVSQEDADAQAEAALAEEGQIYANSVGECVQSRWYNEEMSETFTKSGCDPDTEVGEEVVYTVPAGTYESEVSQDDANEQARADIEANGQAYADANGSCITVKWYNEEMSGSFQKNDCLATETGSYVEYTIEAGRFSSTVSQEDANRMAEEALEAEGQANANEVGECTTSIWYNEEQSETFTRNDCPAGYVGTEYTYTVPAGKYVSTISQDEADQQALDEIANNGQATANIEGECVADPNYFVGVASREFQKNDCEEGQRGTTVTVTAEELPNYPDDYVSTVSQEEANALAEAGLDEHGQEIANEKGTCEEVPVYTGTASKEFTKNDCEGDGVGSVVTVTEADVEGGPFTSEESQEAADALAEAAIDEQGQAIANANGTCTWTGVYSESFLKNDCEDNEVGSSVVVTQDDVEGDITSNISQEDADGKAEALVKEQGQAIANDRGTCNELVFYTGTASAVYTPDCGVCMEAEDMTVTAEMVNGSPVMSAVSQEDADRMAEEILAEGGQAYADKNAECVASDTTPNWVDADPLETECREGVSYKKQINRNECSESYGEEQWVEGGDAICSWVGTCDPVEVQKNDCDDGSEGSTVTVTVDMCEGYPQDFTSYESQEAANTLACELLAERAQAAANDAGTCNECFDVEEKTFYRNDCGSCMEDLVGMTVSVEDVGGPFCSPDYENLEEAQAAYDELAQAYVNINGEECTAMNTDPVWEDVDPAEYECQEGVSMKKQVDTNECSASYGEERWVEGGDLECSWTAPDSSQSFTRNDCGNNGVGGSVTVQSSELDGYPFTSTVSEEDAIAQRDAAFEAQGQDIANSRGTCTWTATYSQSFTRNDCTENCTSGTSVTVSSDDVGGPFTSTVSYEDAYNQAVAAVVAGGQDYANKNGSCESYTNSASWTSTGSTQCSGCTAQYQQRDTEPCSSTYNTTRWVNGGSLDCTTNGTWGSYTYSCSGCTRTGTRTNTCGGTQTTTSTNDANCGTWSGAYWGGDIGEEPCDTHYSIYYQQNSCSGTYQEYYKARTEGQCGYSSCSLGSMASSSQTAAAEGETLTNTVTSTSGSSYSTVTASSDQTWAVPSVTYSGTTATISVVVAANTSTSSRTATITVSNACGESTSYTITQDYAINCAISVSSSSQTFTAQGGSATVNITSTLNGSANAFTLVSGSASWLTVSIGTSSGDVYPVTLTASSNTGTSSRSTTLTFRQSGSCSEEVTVTVTQATCAYAVTGTIRAGSSSISFTNLTMSSGSSVCNSLSTTGRIQVTLTGAYVTNDSGTNYEVVSGSSNEVFYITNIPISGTISASVPIAFYSGESCSEHNWLYVSPTVGYNGYSFNSSGVSSEYTC